MEKIAVENHSVSCGVFVAEFNFIRQAKYERVDEDQSYCNQQKQSQQCHQ